MSLHALPMLALAACVSRSDAAPDELKSAAAPGLKAIRGAALLAHVRFLADDLLEGRGTGTRGHAIAARYVAAQLAALGLEPAGDKGDWFQEHYHHPSDQWSPELRGDRMEREARTYFLIALSVARAAEGPRWNPDSPFAKRTDPRVSFAARAACPRAGGCRWRRGRARPSA